MYGITVLVGSAAWSLIFKTRESWQKARDLLDAPATSGSILRITDDYGQDCVCKVDGIHGFLAEEMAQSKLAHVERQIHGLHIQHAIQQRAEHDPTLRFAARGPAMLSPGMIPQGFNGR